VDSTKVKPVMLPPGWARLAARPLPIGSDTVTNTIGIVCVSGERDGDGEGISDDYNSLPRTDSDRDMTKHQLSRRQFNALCAAVALAWAVRSGNVIAIPEAGSTAHVKENAVALSLTLTPQELQTLDAAFPGPSGAN
jgi:aryl-alcohol dehydrogenase-like predicted oxidoreductase